jgi:hypothetical protein
VLSSRLIILGIRIRTRYYYIPLNVLYSLNKVNRRTLIIDSNNNIIIYSRISFFLNTIENSKGEYVKIKKDIKRFNIKDVINLTRL